MQSLSIAAASLVLKSFVLLCALGLFAASWLIAGLSTTLENSFKSIVSSLDVNETSMPYCEDTVSGVLTIGVGVVKVFVLAYLLRGSQDVFALSTRAGSALSYWGELIMFAWYFYLNFSGFSDLAIGCAGIVPLVDLHGLPDTHDRPLLVTAVLLLGTAAVRRRR